MRPVRGTRRFGRNEGSESLPGEGCWKPRDPADWETRWSRLGRALAIDPDEGLLLALSGGADSVFLLHLLAAARPALRLHVVHVDHGLRGLESEADADFCARLCRELGVPFTACAIELAPEGSGLEERARRARYRCLVDEAVRTGHHTILTGHHSDDALETVLMRWVRGSSLAGLRGPRREWHPSAEHPEVRVVRPLLAMRREEVHVLLERAGCAWREDSSNRDGRFTRNRLRNEFLPLLERIGGPDTLENLRAFGAAVERLEAEFAEATAHLTWRPAPYVRATRDRERRPLGGVIVRGSLMELARPLRRRVLWRLLLEGSGLPPSEEHLSFCLETLDTARSTRLNLRGGWQLVFRAAELHLLPPAEERSGPPPFPETSARELELPGETLLGDGRRLSAELVTPHPSAPVPRDGWSIELDARDLPRSPLRVRTLLPGDRFHPLGGPGSKPLRRYLADRGIPREERARVPLVFAGEELVWVCGYAPCEARRVAPGTRERLRLTLHD